jgi:hypothetical protein
LAGFSEEICGPVLHTLYMCFHFNLLTGFAVPALSSLEINKRLVKVLFPEIGPACIGKV